MTVTLANTSNEYYEVNKSYTTVATKADCSVVYPCDVIHPTFKIKGGYIAANSITGVFDRNYWITNQVLKDGINYISCTVDAFSSWKNSIIGSTQYVTRSETHGNPYLPDNEYPIPSKQEIDMYPSNPQSIIYQSDVHIIGVI